MSLTGYQIKTVSRLTGIPKNTLIAWERRYDLVTPTRLDNGYRVYTSDDLLIINRVKGLLEQGFKISEAALLVLNESADGSNTDVAREEVAPTRKILELQADLIEAIGGYDLDAMDAVFERAASLSLDRLINDVVVPVSAKVGDNWATGKFNIAQEHFATSFMKERLFAIFKKMKNVVDEGKKQLLLACITNERHEIGLLCLGIKLRQYGYPVLYLGSDTPASEVADVVNVRNIDAVALSIVNPQEEETVTRYLEELRSMVPAAVEIFLGGSGAQQWNTNHFQNVRAHVTSSMDFMCDVLK